MRHAQVPRTGLTRRRYFWGGGAFFAGLVALVVLVDNFG